MEDFQKLSKAERDYKLYELLWSMKEKLERWDEKFEKAQSTIPTTNLKENESSANVSMEVNCDTKKLYISEIKQASEKNEDIKFVEVNQPVSISVLNLELPEKCGHFLKILKSLKTKKSKTIKFHTSKSKKNSKQNQKTLFINNKIREIIILKESIYSVIKESKKKHRCVFNQWSKRRKKIFCNSLHQTNWI